jgi:phage tail tube protein FII
VEISTVIARLECTFVLLGLTPQVMELIGSWASTMNYFTAYGVIRDQSTGEAAQAMAVLKGMLGRSDPQNYRRGDVMHTNYSIRCIMHYELNIAGEQVYLWDFPTNTRVIGGVDQNAVINNYLSTGATNVAALIQTTGGFVPGV